MTVVGCLEHLRQAEVDLVKEYLVPGARVLEIGGGSGYQASVIHAWGCDISSIDIAERPVPRTVYYPVQDYDGRHIPFPNASCDLIFSSNVLEHVRDLPALLAETRRVLKPGSLAIHIMPTASWRFWTTLTHYPYMVKRVLFHSVQTPVATSSPSLSEWIGQHNWRYVITRILFPGPHGEYPNAISELYFFSQARWRRVFLQNGFEVVRCIDNGLFYTGNSLFPGLPFSIRRRLSRVLGAAGNIFVLSVGPGVGKAPA